MNPEDVETLSKSLAGNEHMRKCRYAAVVFLVLISAVISGCAGHQGPAGPAGSARAYMRWALGTGMVAGQTRNFTSVSSPRNGVYCLGHLTFTS